MFSSFFLRVLKIWSTLFHWLAWEATIFHKILVFSTDFAISSVKMKNMEDLVALSTSRSSARSLQMTWNYRNRLVFCKMLEQTSLSCIFEKIERKNEKMRSF